MKKYLPKIPKILSIIAILAIGVLAILPHIAHAADPVTSTVTSMITGVALGGVNSFVAALANIALTFTSWLVAVCGIFLSVSINLTVHIKDIYLQIKGLDAVWIIIRDLSSIIIIFSLLYYSIMTILGQGGIGLGKLIMNIFLAGVLINFSLFFVKVAVDASNLVSLQFYNAIAPASDQNYTVKSAFTKGGLSDIFMQSLRIPTFYNNKGVLNPPNGQDVYLGLNVAMIGGIIIMVTAAMSFLAAGIAFSARTAILIGIMALSPLFFVGMIFPEIKKKVGDKLFDLLKGQLIFMPVYLFLLYVALKIISDPSFMGIFNPTTAGATDSSGSGLGTVLIGTIIQYTIAILFINAPLVAAISMGGVGMKWAPNAKDISNRVGGFFGRNTLGRAGRGLGKAFDNMAASASTNAFGRGASTVLRTLKVSQAVRGSLESAEKGKYGGKQNLGDIGKEDKERTKVVSEVQRGRDRASAVSAVLKARTLPSTTQMDKFRENIGKMKTKDFEDMKFEELADPMFAANLSSKQTETLLDSDTLNSKQIDDFKKARKTGLENALASIDDPTLKAHMEKLSGKDLSKLNPSVITTDRVMAFLTPSQLLDMRDIDGTTKTAIRTYITTRALASHKAKGYMNKNILEWS